MALTDRFSPFGLALFGALLVGLLFFAYLMTSRGNNPNGDAPTDGYTDGGRVGDGPGRGAAVVTGLLATVRDEVAVLDVSRAALRRFGLTVGGVFAGLAAIAAWRAGGVPGAVGIGFGVAGVALVFGGLAAPQALRAVYVFWMTAALAMGFVTTRVLLTLVFGLVFVPLGVLFRLVGRDPLHRRPDRAAASYWLPRTDGPASRERMERMY